jgi:O-acetyl-ADP-ribose deacetylase (regulator of RNase III)
MSHIKRSDNLQRRRKNGYPILEGSAFKTTMISCAALKKPALAQKLGKKGKYFDYSNKLARESMKTEIRTIIDAVEAEGCNVAVLSAFGCGAFKNPPEVVAQMFKEALKGSTIETVKFCITDDHNAGQAHNPRGNFTPFYEVFQDMMHSPREIRQDASSSAAASPMGPKVEAAAAVAKPTAWSPSLRTPSIPSSPAWSPLPDKTPEARIADVDKPSTGEGLVTSEFTSDETPSSASASVLPDTVHGAIDEDAGKKPMVKIVCHLVPEIHEFTAEELLAPDSPATVPGTDKETASESFGVLSGGEGRVASEFTSDEPQSSAPAAAPHSDAPEEAKEEEGENIIGDVKSPSWKFIGDSAAPRRWTMWKD